VQLRCDAGHSAVRAGEGGREGDGDVSCAQRGVEFGELVAVDEERRCALVKGDNDPARRSLEYPSSPLS
jgi:hypothetical protein